MKIDIASILNAQSTGTNTGSFKTKANGGHFHAIFGKSLQPNSGKTFFTHQPTPQTGKPFEAKNFQVNLEALRSELLSKGKPFDQVFLKREDVHLVKNLLNRFGYTQKRIDQCLDKLLENSQAGEIQLSQLLSQLKEIGPPEEKKSCQVILASTTIPYIESVLGEFNLSSDELSQVLHAGRTKEGGLDFDKLLKEIEIVSNPASRRFSGIVDMEKSQSITKDLGDLGIQVPSAKKSGFLHIEDFITSLKRMAGMFSNATQYLGEQESLYMTPDDLKGLSILMPQTGSLMVASSKEKILPGKATGKATGSLESGKGIPSDVQAAINQVLENVVGAKEKNNSLTSIIAGSKIKFDDPISKKLQADKAIAKQQTLESIEKADHQTASDNGGRKISDSQPAGNVKAATDIGIQSHITEVTESDIIPNKPKLKLVEVSEDTIEQRRSETSVTTHPKAQKSGSALPNYLMDQLGKQIAKSITRGDGVVRLQLKPQELGFVKLEMQLSDNQLSLSVAAENSSVKELLLANIHELKEALVGQGLKLDKLDIQINEGFNPSLSDSQEGLEKEKGSKHGETGREHFLSKGDTADSFMETRTSLRSDSTIELVA